MIRRFRFWAIRKLAGSTPVALNLRLTGGWLCGDMAVRGVTIDFDDAGSGGFCHGCTFESPSAMSAGNLTYRSKP